MCYVCAGQLLAGLLGWPQATFASRVVIEAGAGRAHVTREVRPHPLALITRAAPRRVLPHRAVLQFGVNICNVGDLPVDILGSPFQYNVFQNI